MLNDVGIVYSYRAENDIGKQTFDWRLSESGFMCMNVCVWVVCAILWITYIIL